MDEPVVMPEFPLPELPPLPPPPATGSPMTEADWDRAARYADLVRVREDVLALMRWRAQDVWLRDQQRAECAAMRGSVLDAADAAVGAIMSRIDALAPHTNPSAPGAEEALLLLFARDAVRAGYPPGEQAFAAAAAQLAAFRAATAKPYQVPA